MITKDKALVQSVIDKYHNGMKIIDSLNINDYNKKDLSYISLVIQAMMILKLT